MPRLVLSLVGDDRSGLVNALAEVVSRHGGNWETSQLAELAGAFAGVVVVTIPEAQIGAFQSALGDLEGLLKVAAHPGSDVVEDAGPQLSLSVLGNDHPGIVREVTAVLTRHGLSIESMTTQTRDAPMSGGRLFEATTVARIPASAQTAQLRADLEALAAELLVDITVDPAS